MKYKIKEGNYSHMGTQRDHDTITFTFEGERESDCAILLYAKSRVESVIRIPVPKEDCIGSLRSVSVVGIPWERYYYNFEVDGEVKNDPYARRIIGREKWADGKRKEQGYRILSGFDFTEFQWDKEKRPIIAKSDMVMYKLHVRGFSMDDPTIRGRKKGTFAAVEDKIPYLRELGITTVEFMPLYEFEEFVFAKVPKKCEDVLSQGQRGEQFELQDVKVNFWGYSESNYFAPKASDRKSTRLNSSHL